MRYVETLVEGNAKSLYDMLKNALAQGFIVEQDVIDALHSESQPLAVGANVHQLSLHSEALMSKIMKSPDRDMLIIVKKILKSTRYAVVTYRTVTGNDKVMSAGSV